MLAAFLGTLAVAFGRETGADTAPVELGRLPRAPTLDGRMSPDEGWAEAVAIPLGEAGRAEVRAGWHGEAIFAAFRTPVPAEGLLRRAVPRDGRDAPSRLDESVEVWLGGASPDAPLVRVIANANDALWDAEYRRRDGGWVADPARATEARSASRIDAGWWTVEIRLPLPEGSWSEGLRLRLGYRAQRPERTRVWPPGDLADPQGRLAPIDLVTTNDPARALARVASAADPAAPESCDVWSGAAEAVDYRVAWLPYTSKLRLVVDLAAVPGASQFTAARAALRRRGDRDPVWTGDLALVQGRADVVRALPDLADGVYDAALELLPGEGCAPVAGPSASFQQRRFAWAHNGLGEADAILPPFTPLTVSGRAVGAVLREHRVNDLGLPDQITSAGEPLLAAPAGFRVRVGGRDVEPVAARPVRIVRESAGRVRTEAEWSAGGLRARTFGAFEMDGMWRIDLELSGNGERVDRLDLVIPLRDRAVTLLNAITDGARHHTLGAVPAGEGSVWSSLDTKAHMLPPEFVPYVWVGEEERGLAWFAASREGWWLAPGRPGQELVRRGDVLELVVHLAARRGTLRGTRTLTFGLQATPTKPRPQRPRSWRTWQLVCRSPFPVFRLCPLPSGQYWGAESPYGTPYPRDHDDSLLRYFGRVLRYGVRPDRGAIEKWLDARDLRDADVRESARAGLRYALRAVGDRPDAVAMYVNLHGSSWTPEFAVYTDEWRSEPFGDRAGGDANRNGEIKIRTSPSWNDYVLWYLDRHLDTQATDGFFFDNTYLKADFNEVEGSAHRGEDGVLHAGVDLFTLRDLMKRAQTLVYERRGAWLNISHMTTTPIVPIQTWAGVSLGGEWKYGTDDYQDRFSRELLRATSLGAKTGTVSAYLPGLSGNPPPAERRRLERGLAGVTAVHEIRVMARMEGPLEAIWRSLADFGYGRPGTDVRRYWDRERGFSLTGADAEALVVASDGRALALLVSFGDGGDVEIGFDRTLASGGACRDLEGRTPPPRRAGRGCRVHLARHDFRLVAWEPRGGAP